MSVLKNIVDKKNKGEIKSESVKCYDSKVVGEKIEFEKRPLSHFMYLVGDINFEDQDMSELVPLMNRAIFDYATMFRDKDAVAMAMEAYPQAESPAHLPELIFESNLDELSDMFELISSFYESEDGSEIAKVRDDIKN